MDVKKNKEIFIYLNKLKTTLALITILSSEMIYSLRGKPVRISTFINEKV